ncbi:MAG: carnitine dehydratase [Rhodospirillaceae bacterium]|nr:MAG: carnitine dehydratase [Rhodospirillaceae bacterium]
MLFNALAGTRVLDLSQYLPGPLATLTLADFGADVLKIEPPLGDPMRGMPPLGPDGISRIYKACNRNKTTLRLDLKSAAGKASFERLLKQADVLLESFRPDVLTRLGFPRERINALNPRLIHCALTGYGQDGPLASTPGHDLNYMALAGGLATSGSAERPGFSFPPVADHAAALHAAMAMLAALLERTNSGRGVFLDISIAESVLPWQRLSLAVAEADGADISRTGHELNGGAAYYQIYETKDGAFVTLGCIEEKFWKNFCEAVGQPDWIHRQGEAIPQTDLIAALREKFATATLAEWLKTLGDVDCCFQAIVSTTGLVTHPHLHSRGFLQRAQQDGEAFTEILFPARANDAAPATRREWRETDAKTALEKWDLRDGP